MTPTMTLAVKIIYKNSGNGVLDIRNGDIRGIKLSEGAEGEWIEIPATCWLIHTVGLNDLIDYVYGDLRNMIRNADYLKSRAIL